MLPDTLPHNVQIEILRSIGKGYDVEVKLVRGEIQVIELRRSLKTKAAATGQL